jgi:WD40 repeat protein
LTPVKHQAHLLRKQSSKMESKEALVLNHVFGVSPGISSVAVSLSGADSGAPCVAFAAAHTVVVYDHGTRQQSFLQGHRNAITCLAAPADRSLLISADTGPDDSLLVGWDPASGQPLWSVPRPHATGGVAAMALSADGQLLATLSAVGGGGAEDGTALAQEVREGGHDQHCIDISTRETRAPNLLTQYCVQPVATVDDLAAV